MRVKTYHRPEDLQGALELLGRVENGKIIAGGTDLVIALNERHIRPDALIDISGIEELFRIYEQDDVLHMGAMSRFSTLEGDMLVKKYCPSLCEAAGQMGAVQVRNLATVGGNVANAATAADSLPSLLSVGAEAVIASAAGTRVVPVSQVVVGINRNSLAPNEMLVEFLLPKRSGWDQVFEKIGRRKALAISRINLAVAILREGNRVKEAAVAVGAVGKTAYRVDEVEAFLQGKTLDGPTIAEAAELMDEVVARNLAGRSTTPYKRKIASAVLKRGLERIAGGAAE